MAFDFEAIVGNANQATNYQSWVDEERDPKIGLFHLTLYCSGLGGIAYADES